MGYWINIDGGLKSISVGNASNIWGYNSGGIIYKRAFGSGPTDKAWEQCEALPNGKTIGSISVGDCGHVLACDTDSVIYRWDEMNNIWRAFSTGGLTKVNVGDNYNIWGINAGGTGWIYAMDEVWINSGNTQPLLDATVGADGSAIVLGNTGTVYRYLPLSRRGPDETQFRAIGGISEVEEIASADESFLLALTKADGAPRLQRYIGENIWAEFPFKNLAGQAITEKILKVSLGGDGTIIALTDNTTGPSNIWQYIPYDVQPPTAPPPVPPID